MFRIFIGLLIATYLSVMAFFAFRPFERISPYDTRSEAITLDQHALHIEPGSAYEVGHSATAKMRRALMESGAMSLEISLRTDSIAQGGPARILSFSRNAFSRNFTLAQEGNALSFRLRTTETDHNALLPNLIVPGVFNSTNRLQHLVITYNGARLQVFVDGMLRSNALDLQGRFSDWGSNHLLVVGDEPPGGKPWQGWVERFAIYDRALGEEDVRILQEEGPVGGAVLNCDFREVPTSAVPIGIKPMRYRNLFIITDNTQSTLGDCVFNIFGFLPFGALVYLLLPARLEKRKVLAAILIPGLLGFFVSGCIEGNQQFILNRIPSALDVLYNVSGTLLGSLVAWLALSQFRLSNRDE